MRTKPKKRWISITYEPKIAGVRNGTITQSIRIGQGFIEGDEVAYYGWSGRPYRSKWGFRTPYFKIVLARPIVITPGGIIFVDWNGEEEFYKHWGELNVLARLDGMMPPTGEELGRVLNSIYKISPEDGVKGQILRWNYIKDETV